MIQISVGSAVAENARTLISVSTPKLTIKSIPRLIENARRERSVGVGDEVMATGDAAYLYAETDKKVLIVDLFGRPRYHELFRGNPKIWRPQEWRGRVSEHPLVRSAAGARPYADYVAIQDLGAKNSPGETDRKRLRKAAGCLKFIKDYRVKAGEVFLDVSEEKFGETTAKQLGSFVVIEPAVKGRVPTKQWGVDNWQALADLLIKDGKNPIQFNSGKGAHLRGVHHVKTTTFRLAMSVMKHASGFVVPEGGLHHAFGSFHKKGVALFAGRTPLGMSYPEQLTWYIPDKHAPCGIEHTDCPRCRQHWNALTPSHVFEMLRHQCG